jgi:hypothetical protein
MDGSCMSLAKDVLEDGLMEPLSKRPHRLLLIKPLCKNQAQAGRQAGRQAGMVALFSQACITVL